ncbi:hypothetical protein PybrP1_004998 [[Pythium] brassicae (nom. inval.)]|nr:hypothetical protein PybrP1_004998 [[Pythium] brassicae (nom. inval.)]
MADDAKAAAQLSEFLDVLTSYAPTLPEELVEFHLQQAGFATSDPRIVRLVALAAHKFLLDVAHDALQFQRIRSAAASGGSASSASTAAATSLLSASGGGGASGSRVVLTMEDLAASLKEYGVNLCKPEYFSDVAHEPQ